jgi:ABC-type lipopolysaccharide export system ATPase subunit
MTTSDVGSDDRVDFQLRRGEILGYLGPNGSGNLTGFIVCALNVTGAGSSSVMV